MTYETTETYAMPADVLGEICTLTLELTRLRQNEVKHLCIENCAPEIFESLLRAWYASSKANA